MPEITEPCFWLEDRCERPAIGSASHAVHGVIPICDRCQKASGAPLIETGKVH